MDVRKRRGLLNVETLETPCLFSLKTLVTKVKLPQLHRMSDPHLLGYLVDIAQLVGFRLVRAKKAEGLHVLLHDVPEEVGHVDHAVAKHSARPLYLDGVLTEIGHPQRSLGYAAV